MLKNLFKIRAVFKLFSYGVYMEVAVSKILVYLMVFLLLSVSEVVLTPKESPGFSTRCNCRVLILRHSLFIDCECCP